jgi:hypothetical protein
MAKKWRFLLEALQKFSFSIGFKENAIFPPKICKIVQIIDPISRRAPISRPIAVGKAHTANKRISREKNTFSLFFPSKVIKVFFF